MRKEPDRTFAARPADERSRCRTGGISLRGNELEFPRMKVEPLRRDFVARREKRPADLVCFEMVGALAWDGGWSVEVS
jgi:hypothetical protein